MMLAKRNNNWMSNLFDDFLNTEWMPRLNATAPAVNVKETEKSYEMEVAAPGLKKSLICAVSSIIATTNRATPCPMTLTTTRFQPELKMAFYLSTYPK